MGKLEIKSSVHLHEEEDFVIFLFYKDDEINGINFHFGTGGVDYKSFNEPNIYITEIYNRIAQDEIEGLGVSRGKHGYLNTEEKIIKAIRLYINAFLWFKE